MRRIKLLLNFIGLNTYLGVVVGAILSIPYYLIFAQFSLSVFMMYTMLFGAMIGGLVGGVNGLALGVITLGFFQNVYSRERYRITTVILSILLTAILAFVLIYSTLEFYSVTRDAQNLLFPSLTATFIATLGSGYVS